MNTNKGSIVKQSGNDVEGCRSEKVLVQPNFRVFLQYSVKTRINDPFAKNLVIYGGTYRVCVTSKYHTISDGVTKWTTSVNTSAASFCVLRGVLLLGLISSVIISEVIMFCMPFPYDISSIRSPHFQMSMVRHM